MFLNRIVFLIVLIPMIAIAKEFKRIKKGECTSIGAKIDFIDGTSEAFPAMKDYKCSDFKISKDSNYAGWKLTGKLIVENNNEKQSYPDALLYIFAETKIYTVTENTRFINDWYFVSGKAQVVAEASFEHGPATYFLFDLKKLKTSETCEQTELFRCKQLNRIVK